jgi:uncharacterized protein (DUF302 family)
LSTSNNGIVQVQSEHSFGDTFERLKSAVISRGLTITDSMDFSDEAEHVGLKMTQTRLLIFGNPKAGTPVMIAAPTFPIDFPLKILVTEDAKGKVWVTYNSPQYLKERHNIPEELLKNISIIVDIAESASK